MLAIRIIPDDIPTSLFEYNGGPVRIITELPENFHRRVIKTLEDLYVNGIYAVEYGNGLIVFTDDNNKSSSKDAGMLCKDFFPTIDLFHWYLNKQNSKCPGMHAVCEDCGSELSSGAQLGDRCPYKDCPSHGKWTEIHEGHVSHENLVQRASMGIPRTGDANSWAQKG